MYSVKISHLFTLILTVLVISCGKDSSPTTTEKTPTYKITTSVSPNEGGAISISPEGTVHDKGTEITLTAQPSSGYLFSEWNGAYSSTNNPLTFTLNEDISVTAVFKEPFYLASNGITVMCPNTSAGDKGFINGTEYESVDRKLLIQRRDEGADLSKVCTSLVSNMSTLFSHSEFNQDIRTWDVSNVTTMADMFFNNNSFNQPLNNWDVSSVTIMKSMFRNASFNQNISGWDVASVTHMRSMFSGSKFNQPLGSWDVSNVDSMERMFYSSEFNQDISGWCVERITSEPEGFSSDSPLTEENKPVWGTCPSN